MVDLIGLYEDETGKIPDNYTVPYTSLQDEVLLAMKPLDQSGSRTSLQDRNPACKRNLLSRT